MFFNFAEDVKVTTATTGTGTLTLGSAVTAFMGVGQLVNGGQYCYTIFDINGTDVEVGIGTYTTSGTTLSRDTVIRSVISGTEGTTKLTLSGAGSSVIIGPSAYQATSNYNASYGFIAGLYPSWTSNTVLGAGPGGCYIESLGRIIYGAPADITPSSPAASTWYHIYAFVSGGVLTLEASTTAPVAFATPIGNACSKTGDTSRRYLYSALTDGSSHFFQFAYSPGLQLMRWRGNLLGSPFRVVSLGQATTATSVACAGAAPVTARTVYVQVLQTSTVNMFMSGGDLALSSSLYDLLVVGQVTLSALNESIAFCPVDSSQNLKYMFASSPSTQGVYMDIYGYVLLR